MVLLKSIKGKVFKAFSWVRQRSFNEIYLTLTFINISFTLYTYEINKKPPPAPYITCDFDNTLFINQYWGNIIFNQNMLISNYGDALGTIYAIRAHIESLDKGNNFSLEVLAQNTYDNGQSYKVLPINLAANGWVQNQYSLYREMSDQEFDYISRLADTMNIEKRSKKYNYKISNNTRSSFFHYIKSRTNTFKKGNYVYLISILNVQGEVTMYKCFTFTFSETNAWQLNQRANDIIDPSSSTKQVVILHLKTPSQKINNYMVQKYLKINP